MGLERLIIVGLEQATPFLVSATATLGESITLWKRQQDDLRDDDIVFQDERSGREVDPNDLVQSLMGEKKELKLRAYQREVTIEHNGILEDCDGAPTLQGIVQNFATMNKLNASDYSLLLQRRPLRYLLRKKVEVAVRVNDSTTRTVSMDIDDLITSALEGTESEQFDIHHGSTNAIIASTLSPRVIWPKHELPEDGKRTIYLKPKKQNVVIRFQGEETVYAARADVALRKLMNTWCAAKRIAARFWTEEGNVAHERMKVSDITGPLKVEVMSDKVLFTIIAHNGSRKSTSKIRGNSMHPIQSVMDKWCELQGLPIDECRFEWRELALTGIEVPAFLGMEDEEKVDVFPSGTTPRMLKTQTASARVVKSGEHGAATGSHARPATRGLPKTKAAVKTRASKNGSKAKAKVETIIQDSKKNAIAGRKARAVPKAKVDKQISSGNRRKKKGCEPASSDEEDETPKLTSARRSGRVLQDLLSPMPIRATARHAGTTLVEKPAISGEDSPGIEKISGKNPFASGQATLGAVNMPRKRERRPSLVDLPKDDKKHMTYDEWEKWDKQEEKRIKRLREKPTEQEQINIALALSLSEATTQERD